MTEESKGRQLLDAASLAKAEERMVAGVSEILRDGEQIFLAGIATRGVPLSARVARGLKKRGIECGLGTVDISMYRDDLGMRGGVPLVQGTDLPLDMEKWSIVLVDDVQHTGRTARAALDAVLAFGRPKRILFAVLVDRGGHELPVRPDVTGVVLEVAEGKKVRVRLMEVDKEEGVYEL